MHEIAGIGYVDGSVNSTTQRFDIVLDDDAIVELDDIVVCRQQLPQNAGELAHYGDHRRRDWRY